MNISKKILSHQIRNIIINESCTLETCQKGLKKKWKMKKKWKKKNGIKNMMMESS